DGGAEGVDGGDLGPLQDVQGLARPPPLLLRRGLIRTRALQPLAQAQLHGGGRVFGEGHGGELLEPRVPAADQGLDAVDEEGGLAGAGARLEHEARGVVVARLPPGVAIHGPGAHPMSLSFSIRWTRASPILYWRRRSRSGAGPQAAV